MKKIRIVPIILLAGLCTLAQLGSPAPAEAGVVTNIVLYIPNRVFDLVDIFRFRVRVGPGISAGVRVTRPASAFVGFHSSAFVGLPGPRGKRSLPLPVGFDLRSGAQLSVADVSAGTPHYDFLELGGELQLFIVGANVGIGGIEILDFLAGLIFIDIMDDDLGRGSDDEDDTEEAEELETEEDAAEEAEELEAEEDAAEEAEELEAEESDEAKAEEPEAADPEA